MTPEPNSTEHRQALVELIGLVVRGGITESAPFITEWAGQNIPASDRARFVEIAQQEMDSLHESNIARFRLTNAEFVRWRQQKSKGQEKASLATDSGINHIC